MWSIGGAYGMCLLVLSVVMSHQRDCSKSNEKNTGALARIEEELKTITAELGTHETGLRGRVHIQGNALLKIDGRVTILEDKR